MQNFVWINYFCDSLLLFHCVLTGAGAIRVGWNSWPIRVWGSCRIPGCSESTTSFVEGAQPAGVKRIATFFSYSSREILQNPTTGLFCFLWVARGPCWCFRDSHDCHSGAVRPQQRLHTPGQLQLLSSLSVLHGEWPRLYKISPGYGNSLQKSEWLKPRGHSLCVQGCWKVQAITELNSFHLSLVVLYLSCSLLLYFGFCTLNMFVVLCCLHMLLHMHSTHRLITDCKKLCTLQLLDLFEAAIRTFIVYSWS